MRSLLKYAGMRALEREIGHLPTTRLQKDKTSVNERQALLRLRRTYGFPKLEASYAGSRRIRMRESASFSRADCWLDVTRLAVGAGY